MSLSGVLSRAFCIFVLLLYACSGAKRVDPTPPQQAKTKEIPGDPVPIAPPSPEMIAASTPPLDWSGQSDEQVQAAIFSDVQKKMVRDQLPDLELPWQPPPSSSPLDEIAELNLYSVEIDPSLEGRVSEDLRESRFDFPVVVNEQVLRFLEYYQDRGRKTIERGLSRRGEYMPIYREVFQAHGLPNDLIYMAHIESLFNPLAYSRARARGIWQFVAGTARLYGLKINWWLDERSDVRKSTEAAARYLEDLYEEFGDWYLALAAYNGGPGRVRRAIRRAGQIDYWAMAKRRLLPRDTRNYVPSILAAMIIHKNPERYGFDFSPGEATEFETLQLDYQVDIRVIAESIGAPIQTIANLNPELRRGVTPFEDSDYELKVPLGTAALLRKKLAEIPPEKRLKLRHHKVRSGETLSHIALKYGSSIRAIAEVNRIRNIHRLRLGQDLVIPLSDWRAFPDMATSEAGPPPDYYQVRRGDSPYSIARRFGIRLADLLRWNNLNRRSIIYPGQRLRLMSPELASSGQE